MDSPTLPHLKNLVEQAKEDLAIRLSIPASQIELLEAKDVVWPDSSLGCPQPGMLYMQALTPGYLIKLLANGREYEYHAGGNRKLILCPNPSPPFSGIQEEV